MSKYIDAEKLIVQIDNLESFSCISEEQDGFYSAISRINDIIDSLQQEQPEVDLDEEITAYIESHFHIRYDETLEVGNDPLTTADFEAIARHFFELGLNARKEK